LTTDTLRHVALSGSVGRSESDSGTTIALTEPGEIAPGQSRQQVVAAEVSAPSIGTMTWRVVASGAGPTVTTTLSTRHRPVMLLALLMILVLVIAAFVFRRLVLRRAAREAAKADDAIDLGSFDAPQSDEDEAADSEHDHRQPVSAAS
jgi:hypothetical protein